MVLCGWCGTVLYLVQCLVMSMAGILLESGATFYSRALAFIML